MLPQLTSQAIDLGIVVCDLQRSLDFYCDVLGFEDLGETPVPGGGRMRRLLCGESAIKLLELDEPRPDTPDTPVDPRTPPATGYRYWTVSVSNLPEIQVAVALANVTMIIPPTEIRPGVKIMMIADPDGNWIEFADYVAVAAAAAV